MGRNSELSKIVKILKALWMIQSTSPRFIVGSHKALVKDLLLDDTKHKSKVHCWMTQSTSPRFLVGSYKELVKDLLLDDTKH